MSCSRHRPVSAVLAGLFVAMVGSCGDDPELPRTPHFGDATAEELVAAMTLAEKVDQMHGLQLAPIDGLYYTPPNDRLGIPSFRMVDGPRGVRAGNATAFPVSMARGATWDVELERRVGRAIGREAAAKGANVLLAPTINVLRHPQWGRAQETYGEDTVHVGAMGVAFIEGAQEHVLASVKHFAANSIEDTRFDVNVSMEERTLREVYLPHFRRAVVDGRVASVMSAYNFVNGQHASENEHLLRDILKGEWGFEGFVESDWVFGTRSTLGAANGGLDVEMPSAVYFGQALIDAVEAGELAEPVVDEAALRIVGRKVEFADRLENPVQTSEVETEEHVALAREAATKSLVLLKNDLNALPLSIDAVETLVVVGALAEVANLGDLGSSSVTPSAAVTPLDGIREHATGERVTFIPGPELTPADEEAIASASAVIVVVGLTTDDEGEGLVTEGGDRDTLSLAPEDDALVSAVAALSDRTVVILEGGSAILVRPWIDSVEALVFAWYPGMQGGAAIADLLFGAASPGGRLPLSFPRDPSDLPVFDNGSFEVEYGFLHGYRWIDAHASEPEFAFGFGLGYTTFEYADVSVEPATVGPDGETSVELDVTNTGDRDGADVVQVYVRVDDSAVERAPKDLRAFVRVELAAGETRRVNLTLRASDLAHWDVDAGAWTVEPTTYTIEIGASSRDIRLERELVVTASRP